MASPERTVPLVAMSWSQDCFTGGSGQVVISIAPRSQRLASPVRFGVCDQNRTPRPPEPARFRACDQKRTSGESFAHNGWLINQELLSGSRSRSRIHSMILVRSKP